MARFPNEAQRQQHCRSPWALLSFHLPALVHSIWQSDQARMPGKRSGAVNRCLPARVLPIENVFTGMLRAFPEIYDRLERQLQLVSQPSGSRRQTPLCGCPSFGIGECVMVFVWYFTPPSSSDWHLFWRASRSLKLFELGTSEISCSVA